jgi:hypothetical protein
MLLLGGSGVATAADDAATSTTPTRIDEVRHLENQNSASLRARQQMLLTLSGIAATKLKDLSRELRETSIKLSIDGMGAPGRMSAKELELAEIMRRQTEIESTLSTTKAEYDTIAKAMKTNAPILKIESMVENDETTAALRKELGELEAKWVSERASKGEADALVLDLQKRRDAVKQALAEHRQAARAEFSSLVAEDLRVRRDRAQSTYESWIKRLDAIKEDLGALNNLMTSFVATRDVAQSLRDRLARIDTEMDEIDATLISRGEQPSTRPAEGTSSRSRSIIHSR